LPVNRKIEFLDGFGILSARMKLGGVAERERKSWIEQGYYHETCYTNDSITFLFGCPIRLHFYAVLFTGFGYRGGASQDG
jgi:hypothetical protein